MSLKIAQEIITVEEPHDEGHVATPFFEIQDQSSPTLEAHPEEEPSLCVELNIENPENVELKLPTLPGAPEGTPDPKEPEVIEVQEKTEEDKDDVNDAKSQKQEKWDWAKSGPEGFVTWIKERFDSVPKHSGYNSAGIERALSYLEFLNKEVSRAMRLDIDAELDENKVEEVQAQIDEGIERLQERLDKVEKTRKGKKRRKKSEDESQLMVKEAQKITGVHGIMVVVPLLISRIARVCINGMVSAGRDIEDVYSEQVKKYKLNDREQAEVLQLMNDMGYSIRQDRAYLPFEDVEEKVKNNEGVDYAVNYAG